MPRWLLGSAPASARRSKLTRLRSPRPLPRRSSLAVWGNPFLRRAVPPAFEEVLTERGVSLGVRRPDPPARLPAYEHAAVRGRDSVVNSHRPAEVVMRTLGAAARAAPAQPQG